MSTESLKPIWLKAELDNGMSNVIKLDFKFCQLNMARLNSGPELFNKIEG